MSKNPTPLAAGAVRVVPVTANESDLVDRVDVAEVAEEIRYMDEVTPEPVMAEVATKSAQRVATARLKLGVVMAAIWAIITWPFRTIARLGRSTTATATTLTAPIREASAYQSGQRAADWLRRFIGKLIAFVCLFSVGFVEALTTSAVFGISFAVFAAIGFVAGMFIAYRGVSSA